MSLTQIWNELQYKMASWGVYEPRGVHQDLLNQGWTFEIETLPLIASAGGMPVIQTVAIPKTPEGVSILTDNAARERYNQAYQQAVDKAFGRTPTPPAPPAAPAP